MTPVRPILLALAAAAALGAAGCGDSGNDPEPAARAAGDPERYCALVAALDRRGEQVFADVERDAAPDAIRAAERRFVTEAAADLTALRASAPAALRDDAATFVAAMRGRAGLEDAPPAQAAASAAEERLLAYEERSCGN